MKKSATLLSIFLAGGLIISQPSSAATEDLTNHWAYGNIQFALEKGFLQGYEDGTILPDQTITRAEFAKILVQSLNLTLPSNIDSSAYANQYLDVTTDEWFYQDVITSTYFGLVSGNGDGTFTPNKQITREEMAVMLERAVTKVKQYNSSLFTITYIDNHSISDWAVDSVKRVYSNGLMEGLPDGTFSPKKNTSRAEAVTVTKRLLEIDPSQPIKYGPSEVTITYPTSFQAALDKQMAADPKADGAGLFKASRDAVAYYMNPGSTSKLDVFYYQFLKLTNVIEGVSAQQVNSTALANVGTLSGQAEAFIQAGKENNINFLYLMAHAFHETGKGKSNLASGIEVGVNANGVPTMVTQENRAYLTNIYKTYNVYGVRALDGRADKTGSEYAYSQGWFTVADAIKGGASSKINDYLKRGQDTLYKMRWNPANTSNVAMQQYATHIVWASTMCNYLNDLYKSTGADKTSNSVFEIPRYVDQPIVTTAAPSQEQWYDVDTRNAGIIGTINTNGAKFKKLPGNYSANVLASGLNYTSTFTVIGENNGWFKVSTSNGLIGWVDGTQVIWPQGIVNSSIGLNVRSKPSTSSTVLTKLENNAGVYILEIKYDWYRIYYYDQEAWVHRDYIRFQ